MSHIYIYMESYGFTLARSVSRRHLPTSSPRRLRPRPSQSEGHPHQGRSGCFRHAHVPFPSTAHALPGASSASVVFSHARPARRTSTAPDRQPGLGRSGSSSTDLAETSGSWRSAPHHCLVSTVAVAVHAVAPTPHVASIPLPLVSHFVFVLVDL
jgi:hypothetical protein